MAVIMDRVDGIMIAPPMPKKARKPISILSDVERAQANDPMAKMICPS